MQVFHRDPADRLSSLPTLDEYGLLRQGAVWVALSPIEARMIEAESNGVNRKQWIMLPAGEPFFLRSRDDPAVHNERRRTVVVIGGDSENAHAGR